jgi:DNA-binding NarL/FixJ family response regulator
MKKNISNTKLQILIADDHPIFRKGLILAIEADDAIEIIGEAGDGRQALQLAEELKPDVVVLDIEMPMLSGLEVAAEIIRRKLPVDIVFLTMYKEEDMFNEAMNIGAKGYVLKENAVSDIVESIKNVASGRYFISPNISEFLVNRSDRVRSLLRKKPNLEKLTATERKVLKLISEIKTSKDIAGELFISYRTVENHRSNICNKLEIHGSHSLLKFAIEHKALL